ncbi:MAG: GTPase Era [Bacteroidota bacterium]
MESPLLDLSAVPDGFRSGYVALVGAPNAGKSTLMNALLGTKLSIVTDKPSTTRHRVLGILTGDTHQVIFLDTPGVVKPRYKLHEHMMHDVERALADADLVLFLSDAEKRSVADRALARLSDQIADTPCLLVLTKMDLISHEEALPLVEEYVALRAFDAVLPTSAVSGFNLDALRDAIVERLPQGPAYYPPDQLSEHPERFFIAEIVREQIFKQFRAEVPYSTQVNVTVYEEREGQKDFCDCEIVVERDAQKGILIGKRGAALKRLGAAARREIEAFTRRALYLQLHVKTRADWRNRDGFLRSYGYGS